jgi:hypothetical protein
MQWGDIAPLRTRTIRLLEGDLCVLAVNKYGLQVDDANLYCTIELRPTNMALRTMQARMDSFKEKIVGDITIRKNTLREGLSEEAKLAFLNAIKPGHPTNPFPVRHQVRNYALWLPLRASTAAPGS